MKFADVSPVLTPSLDQQQDALRKGLGRGLMWARSRVLRDDVILRACIEDQRHDSHCEDSRGDWLWDIIQQVNGQDRLSDAILQSLRQLNDESSADQLCRLARYFAERGDDRFRKRLYQIVETKPFADFCPGEEEVIALDGELAFLLAARVRGMRLASREWEWDDRNLTDIAIERFGRDRAIALLETSSDAYILRFFRVWLEDERSQTGSSFWHDDPRWRGSVNDILAAANGTERCYWFRGWGTYADDEQLKTILTHILQSQSSHDVSRLLRVFANRALPEFEPRLVELFQHENEAVRQPVVAALAMNSHPTIRALALEQFAADSLRNAIALIKRNFEPGDEERILNAITLPEDACDRHWLLMDVIDVLKTNSVAECSRLAVVTYFETPCMNCRVESARLLRDRKVAPAWLAEECRFDADETARQLFDEQGQ